jgi:hypothetical protein
LVQACKKIAPKFQKCVKNWQQLHLTHWRLNNNIGYEREMHLHNHNSGASFCTNPTLRIRIRKQP